MTLSPWRHSSTLPCSFFKHTQLTRIRDQSKSVFSIPFASTGSWRSPGTQVLPAAGVTTPGHAGDGPCSCSITSQDPCVSLLRLKYCAMLPAGRCPPPPLPSPGPSSLLLSVFSGSVLSPLRSGEGPVLPQRNSLPPRQPPPAQPCNLKVCLVIFSNCCVFRQ